MRLQAQGGLQHHFWGDYCATVSLKFDCPDCVNLALPKLPAIPGVKWRSKGEYVATLVDGAHLEQLKPALGKLGADVAAIDSVEHSIDYGDPFTVTVEVEDPRQLTFA